MVNKYTSLVLKTHVGVDNALLLVASYKNYNLNVIEDL